MRKILVGVTLLLTSALVSGCGTSTAVSQYAGLPRDALPKDHFEYVPAKNDRHDRAAKAASQTESTSAEDFSIDDENRHLAKALKICRNCVSPSRESADTAQASDDPSSSPLREAQTRH
jgi:hypothetical protein